MSEFKIKIIHDAKNNINFIELYNYSLSLSLSLFLSLSHKYY